MAGNTFENKKLASKAGKKSKRGPSKATKKKESLLNMLTDLLKDEDFNKKFKEELMGLSGKQFLDAFATYLEYIKPKLSRSDNTQKIVKSEIAQLMDELEKENQEQ